jgi:hypothetical protein
MKLTWRRKPSNQQSQSVQDLIPLQNLDQGIVVTNDDRLVQILKVSAVNTELMSQGELYLLLENYEAFLKSVTFPIHQEIVSMPIDLDNYIRSQEEQYDQTKNFNRKTLLRSYIEYTKNMSNSRKIMRRQRYVLFDQKIKGSSYKAFDEALHELEEKTTHVFSSLTDLELNCERVTNIEAAKLFHIFFNFEASLHQQINPDGLQKITVKNPVIPFHERGNRLLKPKGLEQKNLV